MALPSPQATTVAVGPTSTVILSVDVRDEEWLTAQVVNLDATQTVRCYVERRQTESLPWGVSTIGDFSSIPPSGTVDGDGNPLDAPTADLDVAGTGFIRLVGVASGAGASVLVAYRKGRRK